MNGPIRKEYPSPETSDGAFDAGTSHGKLLKLLRPGQRVLEFGCATGYMSRAIVEMGCRVVGIEIDPAAAVQARAFCEEVVVADLDVRPLADLLPETQFDVAVFGDVLEHLRDPWRVLDDTRAFLKPDGYVAISIPNVAHGAVRLALVSGSFDYAEVGLLDNTHLRFFTLRSVKELCVRAGYAIESIERTKVPMFVDTDVVPRIAEASVEPELLKSIVADPEHDTLQFIIRARPLSDTGRTIELFNQYHESQQQLDEARKQVDELRARIDEQSARQRHEEEDEMLLVEYARRFEELNLKNAELEDELAALAETERTRTAAGEAEVAAFTHRVEELESRNGEFEADVRTLGERIADLEQSLDLSRGGEAEAREALAAEVERSTEQVGTREALESRVADLESSAGEYDAALTAARAAAESAEKRLEAVRELSRVAAVDYAALNVNYRVAETDRSRLERSLEDEIRRGATLEREHATLEREHAALKRERRAAMEARRTNVVEEPVVAPPARSPEVDAEVTLLITSFLQYAEVELDRVRRESTSIDFAIRATRSSLFWAVKTSVRRALSMPKRLLRRE